MKSSTDSISVALDAIASAYPALANALRMAPARARRELREAFRFYERQFVKGRVDKMQPAGIAAGQHDCVDEHLARMLAKHPKAKDISCRAGCSHCCYQAVHITDQEAELLQLVMKNEGKSFDVAKAQRQAAVDPSRWFTQPAEDRGCVLLGDDGRCTVYEDRPLVCRKYFVTSPPEDCDTFRDLMHRVSFITDLRTEVITAAAHVATEGDTLPRMLLAAGATA